MSQAKSVQLYFTEGSSDKVYNVNLEERADGWAVSAANGRRGKPLKVADKITGADYDLALKEYTKLVKSKTSKGYTDQENGAVFTSTMSTGTDTGFRPQLFNEISLDELREMGDGAKYWLAQEKHDGERRPVIWEGQKAAFANRKGIEVSVDQRIADAVARLGEVVGPFRLDSEDMGEGKIVIFDVKEHFMLKTGRFDERAGILVHLEKTIRNLGLSDILQVDVPRPLTDVLAKHVDGMMERGAEGIVVRHVDAIYTADRPSSGGDALKVKFWADVTCRVAEGRAGKRSVGLELLDGEAEWTAVGNVTIPANAAIPEVGSLVDVKYLYAYEGGSLFQPTFRGPRTDVDENECRLDRLKFKANPASIDAPSLG